MNQLMGFGFENKHNKQSLKIYPGTLLCNMMCYGALKSNIDHGLLPWSILLFSAP